MPSIAGRHVGQSVVRREDPRMITGHGRYLANLAVPGALHAVFARSPVARARIAHLDVSAASAMPGVRGVFTGADLNPECGPIVGSMFLDAPHPPLHPLADGDVRFVGHAVAVVVAEDLKSAQDAAELIDVEYETLPPVLDLESALRDDEVVHPELGTNVALRAEVLPDAAWTAVTERAASVVTRTFDQGRATAVPMESRAIMAHWDPWTPELRIWSSTQNAHEVRASASRILGVPEQHIRVIAGDVGGGFGMKIFLSPDEACVLMVAKRMQVPVRWVEQRGENLLAGGHARADTATASLALDAEGRILGMRVRHLEDVGAFPIGGTSSSVRSMPAHCPGPYRVGLVHYSGTSLYTNTCGRVAYRGPWLMETTIREQLLDHAAREIGIDPLELRRRNVVQPEELPYTTASGVLLKNISPAATTDRAAALIGYDDVRRAQANGDGSGALLGVGLANFVEPTGMGAGLLGSDQATVRISFTGSVDVYMGTGSTGNSLETTIPQLVAEHLGCSLDTVTFHQGDTASAPWGHGSGGSRAAVVSGGAAREAGILLRERVVQIAADLLEAAPGDLEIVDSVVSVRGTPARGVSLADVARHAYSHPELTPAGQPPGLEVALRYRPPDAVTYSNATHACVVEVDPDTGGVTLVRYAVSEDCGPMINPMIVDGQIAGGVVQGIAGALFEEFVYSSEGTPLTATLMDYLVPSAAEMPSILFDHVETPSDTSGGFKGMGEGGAIGAPAAVANAICDAIGWRGPVTRLPLSPHVVWSYLQQQRTASSSSSGGGDGGS